MSGSPAKKNMASTYNGTAMVSLKKGPVTGVPISIKLMAMSLWIDPAKTESHFGNTPIYGCTSKGEVRQEIAMTKSLHIFSHFF